MIDSPEAGARAYAGKGMPQIMYAKAGKRGGLGHRRPGLLEIGPGSFGVRARNNKWPHSFQGLQHRERRRIEHNRLSSGLRVGQKQQPHAPYPHAPSADAGFREGARP